jgi:Xaa-Pro aminopeptidase
MTIPKEIIERRRARFLEALDGVAVFPAARTAVRSNDCEYRYRADSDLVYLTGFEEPEAVAVFAPNHPEHKFVLFVRPRDPEREVWDGKRAGVDGALADYGADAAFTLAELDTKLPEYFDKQGRLYYRLGQSEDFDRRIVGVLNSYRGARKAKGPGPHSIIDPGEIVHEMRLLKEPAEIELMRTAGRISAEAHRLAMAAARPGIYEYELEALIEYTFRRQGAAGPSYSSIVGSGANATVLHYIANDRQVQDGDLVLVDAGCEYGYFAADITRTWPVSGRFSEPQRIIYQLVLDAQLAAIEMSRPGVTMLEIHNKVVSIITEGLVELGLIEGPVDEAIREERFKKFFMHKTGHYLGMDVHDVGKYRDGEEWRPLRAGMVMTIEPGIYIAEDCEAVEPKWRGIGVRIEDDILLTADGHEVLSAGAPKTIAEIEAVVGSNLAVATS